MKKEGNRIYLAKGVFVIISFFVALLLFRPSFAGATAVNDIDTGKGELFDGSISQVLAAYQTFSTANTNYGSHCTTPGFNCSLDDARQKARIHGYLAYTRILDLILRDDGGSVDTLTELLAQYGVNRSGDTLEDVDFALPSDEEDIMLPESAPSGETVRSFIDGPLLTALDASIDDMDEVLYYVELAESTGANIDTKEIIEKTYFDPQPDDNIEVDEGDYYLFRAGLKTVKAFALIVSAYDLDVDVREIVAMDNMDAFSMDDFNLKTFLDRYPDFLNLLTSGSTPSVNGVSKLAEAKTTLISAIDDYLTASDKIRNDSGTTAGAGEFIEIDNCELQSEEWFSNKLEALQTSLTNNTPYAFNEETENWTFTDGSGNQLHVELLNNMSEGNWYSMNNCDFIGCYGAIECVTISGNQVTLEFEGNGVNGWANATLTGTLDSVNHQIIGGTFNGYDGNGSISGTFTATRENVTSETENFNLNPLFGAPGPYNLRDFLPQFNEYGRGIAGTMGYGLNPSSPDPTLGGILPDMTQDDWDLEYGACGPVDIAVVANDSIAVDGTIGDWSGISPVFTDESGDDEPNLAGTDIDSFYLAKDDNYLYVAMTLNDGPPSNDVVYIFVAAERYDEYDRLGERSAEAFYNQNTQTWDSRVMSRGDWQTIGDHPGYAVAGNNMVEWKVPLSEMGNLSGKFIRIYTHNTMNSWEPNDEDFPCLRIGPLSSISVDVTIPQYDGTGAVYIGVFPFNGTVNMEPENQISGKIFYPGEYADGTYTIDNLPVGANVIVGVQWDSDYNGLITGDFIAGDGPVTVAGNGSTSVTLTTDSMSAGSLGEPYFRACNVQAFQTSAGMQTSLLTDVFDPDGSVPGTIRSLTVSGPGGFSYQFTPGDIWSGNVYWAGPSGTPAVGEYIFTVTDEDGKTATSRCYFAGVKNIPLPDTTTFQVAGDYSSPVFSWGAVNRYNGNLFYRVRVWENDNGNLTRIWTSGFTQNTITSYSGPPLDINKSYKWRVEAFDNYTYVASNNRSVSDKVDLIFDNETPYFVYATVYNRHDSDGLVYTAMETRVTDPDGSAPGSISSLTVKNPNGMIITNFTSQDYDSFYQDYYHKITGRPVDGVYEFMVTDINGLTKTTYDYVKVHDLPFVDSATLQASGDPLTPTLSWGVPAGIDGSFYYRAVIDNPDGTRVWASNRVAGTMMNVPYGILQNGGSYKWYVRTIDDKNFVHFNNQARSAKVDLTIDNATPYFKSTTVFQRRQPDDLYTAFDVYVIDPDGTVPDSIQSLSVTGPNGYSHTFTAQDFVNLSLWSSYLIKVPGQLAEGVYTFTVTDNESKTAVNHAYLKTVTDIPGFDETSIRMTGDPNAPTISWSGIEGYEGQLYYRLFVLDMTGNIVYDNMTCDWVYGSSREPYTAHTIPYGRLQPYTPYKFRVEAYDHFDWIIYNARSNSNYFSLTTPGGPLTTLTGRVTDKQGNPVANINLYARSQACENQWLSSVKTNDYGIYTFYGLPEGDTYIFACASCSGLPYQNGWYKDGSGNCNNATGVFLSQEEHKTDIDFALYSIGDVNKDGNVDLADAITALKVIAGFEPAVVNSSADVNGDGKIGLAEVIYILQSIAGL